RGPEDEQEQGQRGGPMERGQPAWRRRPALVPVHRQPSRQPSPFQPGTGGREPAQVSAHPVEYLRLFRDLRQSRRLDAVENGKWKKSNAPLLHFPFSILHFPFPMLTCLSTAGLWRASTLWCAMSLRPWRVTM